MRKIMLFAAAAALAACGQQEASPPAEKPIETPAEAVETEALSAADKAAVDALGNDLAKLRADVQAYSGTARAAYAFERMNEAMRQLKVG
jgi:ABC-type glycerol-3-phosphate transport system substrate-binding protein